MKSLWQKDTWWLGWAVAWRAYVAFLGLFLCVATLGAASVFLWPEGLTVPFLGDNVSRAEVFRAAFVLGLIPVLGVSVTRALRKSEIARQIARRLLAEEEG